MTDSAGMVVVTGLAAPSPTGLQRLTARSPGNTNPLATQPSKGLATLTRIPAAFAPAAASLAGPVLANDIDTVRAFYTDILTTPADTTAERYFEIFSPEIVSIPTPPGGPGAQGMLNTIAFLGQVVPDLIWVPEEIIEVGDSRFVVRGTASATPIGPFYGVDPATGNSFEIMSIDIVTVTNGRITHNYHVEDWLGAIGQMTAQ